MRKRLSQQRTRTLNKIHHILHKRNLMWDYPTKSFQTKRGRSWLQQLSLPEGDRLEMDLLLAQWRLWDEQLARLDERIAQRAGARDSREVMSDAELLATIPGVSVYAGLTLASRIGPIDRFPRPASLANYFGLTPGCRNSGETKQRLGSITKQGSGLARFVLGQAVIHVLKKDKHVRQWYRGVRRRRGSKIARVAVMRRLAAVVWHMLAHRQAYRPGARPSPRIEDLHSGSTKGAESASLA